MEEFLYTDGIKEIPTVTTNFKTGFDVFYADDTILLKIYNMRCLFSVLIVEFRKYRTNQNTVIFEKGDNPKTIFSPQRDFDWNQ